MAAKIQAKKETLVLRIGLTGMSVNVVTHDKVRRSSSSAAEH
jgi:hypothetical protein